MGHTSRRLIEPLITGVGPVEAAAATAAALARLDAAGRKPDLVFSLGSAGSRTLEHAGIYQIASVAYRDMDASPLGFPKGATPFLDEPAIIAIPHRIAGYSGGVDLDRRRHHLRRRLRRNRRRHGGHGVLCRAARLRAASASR